jgi:tetratricopeptide (TPR) repeat protein
MMGRQFNFVWVLAFGCFLALPGWPQAGNGDTAPQLAEAGQKALAADQYEEARADFEKLAKLEPGVAEVHATLAAIYFKQREYQLTTQEVRTAQRLKPGLPGLDSLLGLSMAEMGKSAEALPHLEKSFKQAADPKVRRMCGMQLLRVYTALGRDPDAVETALALNKLYPDDPEVLYHTGRVYGNIAYVVMEKLHDKAPGSIWMLQAQGEANESQKAYDAAIVAYNHVLQLDPRRPGIHNRLGRVYLARFKYARLNEDRDAAMREFAAELELDPTNGNARYELANMQAELGNFAEARKQFELVLDRFPDFEEALVGLGGVALETHKPEAAVAPLERATRLRADDEVAWYRLGQAERAIGNREEQMKAMAVFKKIHDSNRVIAHKSDANDELTPQQLDSSTNP